MSHATALAAQLPSNLGRLFVPGAINGSVVCYEFIAGPAMQVQDNGGGSQTRPGERPSMQTYTAPLARPPHTELMPCGAAWLNPDEPAQNSLLAAA